METTSATHEEAEHHITELNSQRQDDATTIPAPNDYFEHISHEPITHAATSQAQPYSSISQPSQRTIKPSLSSHLSFRGEDESEEEDHQMLDPAWGIRRTDSANLLDVVQQRSPSFPMPQSPALEMIPVTTSSDPRSTSGATHEEEEHEADDGEEEEEEEVSHIHHSVDNDDLLPAAEHSIGHADDTDLITAEKERFEEGIPLIPDDHLPTESSTISPPEPSAFADFQEYESIDTSALFSGSEGNPHPLTANGFVLERKDTEQVLSVLGLGDARSDSPPPPAIDELHVAKQTSPGATQASDAFADLPQGDEEDPWKAALADDEDGFLVEDADDLLPDSDDERQQLPPQPQRQQTNQYTKQNASYTPHQPSTSEMSYFGGAVQGNVGLSRTTFAPFHQANRPNITERAASFVDQSKGGYQSPYDLPMDLAPKQKARTQRLVTPVTNLPPPPPRTSSMGGDKPLQSPFTPTTATFNVTSPQTGMPSSMKSPVERPASTAVRSGQPPSNKRTSSGFFEELPVVARVRPSPTSRGPSLQSPTFPTSGQQYLGSGMVHSPPQTQPQSPPQNQRQDPYAQFHLQAPPKLDPYANVASQPSSLAPVPAPTSRYSPAPQVTSNGIKPSPSPRYSPAPPPAPGPRYSPAPPAPSGPPQNKYASQPQAPPPAAASLPFLPRTSSPLAQHRRSVDESTQQLPQQPPQRPSQPHHVSSSSLPFASTLPPSSALSPPRNDPSKQPTFAPPRRSQTQSPSQQAQRSNYAPRLPATLNRPQSAYGQSSPVRALAQPNVLSPPGAVLPIVSSGPVMPASDYIQPTDETQYDPLQRWKGHAVFDFGFGGTVVSSFPVHTPRFSAAAIRPQIKVTAGEVRVKQLSELYNLPEHVMKFPGPLKGKSKKKDVLAWLNSCIITLEEAANASIQPMGDPQSIKQTSEKVLLWKVIRILVENDGNLSTTSAIQSINTVLMPEIYALDEMPTTHYRGEEHSSGIYRPAGMAARTEITDTLSVEALRKALLKGKREDAVWLAVDSRLWSHALLLASTLDRSVWRQVVQEFVKQEVKTIGTNAESLCALYEILGGNLEESVDQLVPPSARAGLQMVNTVDASGPTRNALDGLDRWRETLCLVLNNRTTEDQKALQTLAKLLSDYGRVEASHVCHILARSPVMPNIFGGSDDPATSIVLLGADHKNKPHDFHRDTDAILLTEVCEFAITTLSSSATSNPMPHLAVYKLQRANELTDVGMKTEAQAYCDAIAGGLRSNTKQSMYYHPLLLGQVEDLSNRLKQIPVQSQSWMAKPSIEKVSGSFFKKVNNFITGEDSDAESKGSARDAAEAGPFANVAGSPGISRNASQTDLYGSYPTTTAVAPTTAGSRYAPNGITSTRSSSELVRGRQSFDSQRSPPSTSHSNEVRSSLYAPMMPQQNTYSPLGTSPSANEYHPGPEPSMPSVAEEPTLVPAYSPYQPDIQSPYTNDYSTPQPAFGGFTPSEPQTQFEPQLRLDEDAIAQSEPSQPVFEPPQSNYSGYAPPEDAGYVPYQADPDSEEDDEKPARRKKKSFLGDDDDDDFPRASNISPQPPQPYSNNSPAAAAASDATAEAARKKANDEAAEAAFRAAAAADADRKEENSSNNSNKKSSGSWFGGFFGSGSKKADSLDTDSSGGSGKGGAGKVYRAKLGESKMKLYYDKEKGKWINPDNPDAGEKKIVAPPPRSGTPGSAPSPALGGPPRAVSSPLASAGMMSPPPPMPTPSSIPLPASRTGTPALGYGGESDDSRPGTSSGAGLGIAATLPPGTSASLGLASPPSSAGPGGPPSRPLSSLGNSVTGLDDLLGGPPTGARKTSGRAGARGAKKGRYVDVMAK